VSNTLLLFDLFETRNDAMLLWRSSCSFCDLQHCCGEAPAGFEIRYVVLVKLLLVL